MRRIFLSYGHDEHADLARRLKRDLESRGHDVWFDEERLLPGEDWEACIERGLDWASATPGEGRVILLMTPHSVRRPDGYCLNELAHALGRGLRILPAMVVWAEPPLSISRIQWLDLRDCIPIDAQPAAYERKLARLAEAIDGDRIDFDGSQARLRALLDPLSFDVEIGGHLSRFTGRTAILEEIDRWVASPEAGRIFWITGPPGIGKSALVAKLVATRREVMAVHFCVAGHSQKADARRAVQSIAYQLATQLPEYHDRLSALPIEQLVRESDAATLFDRLIVEPLGSNFESPQQAILIVIDALDEATAISRNPLAELIGANFTRAPRWLRLVVTSRPDAEILYTLQGLSRHVIDAATPDNEADLRAFLTHELRSHLLDVRDAGAVVDAIVARSEGSFLYAEWVRQEVIEGRLGLQDVEKFPRGLGGSYARFASRQWPDTQAFARDIAPALEVFAASKEPLSIHFVGPLLDWNERRRIAFEDSLGSLFVESSGELRPFHKSLLDWLTNRRLAGPYYLSIEQGDKVLADFALRQVERAGHRFLPVVPRAAADDVPAQSTGAVDESSTTPAPTLWAGADDYASRHVTEHLIGNRRWDALEDLILDPVFLENHLARNGAFDLASMMESAARSLPDERPRSHLVRLIEQAIRREVHFIARHPETLFQCLWNLCWWYDCPELRPHVVGEMSEPGGRARLHALMEAWRGEKEAKEPGFVWVRSLRPPRVPLGAGYLALGGHTDTVHAATASADGTRLVSGARDCSIRVWETQSGQQLARIETDRPAYVAEISPDGQSIVGGPLKDGTLGLWSISGQLLRRLKPHNAIGARGGVEVECAAFDHTGRFIAAGGAESTVTVFDAATGAILEVLRDESRNRVESVAFLPDSGLLLSGGGWGFAEPQDIRVWDWSAKQQLRRFTAHQSLLHRIRVSPLGDAYASCSGDARGEHAIKVWSATAVIVMRGHSGPVEDIGFSPDGRTIASASWDRTVRIWDAATGRQLRQIDAGEELNAIGYLPDGRFYTGGHDKLLKIWDASGVFSLATRPDSEVSIWAIAFSSNGEVLATGDERGQIWLWRAKDGQPLGRTGHIPGPVLNIAFSPDGRRFAVTTGVIPLEEDEAWGGAADKSIRIFDVASIAGTQLVDLWAKIRPDGLAYSRDGSTLSVTLDGGDVVKLDTTTFQPTTKATEPYRPATTNAAVEPVSEQTELVFRKRDSKEEIAWFSTPLFDLVAHPTMHIWAGKSDRRRPLQSTANKLDLIALEGMIGPVDAQRPLDLSSPLGKVQQLFQRILRPGD